MNCRRGRVREYCPTWNFIKCILKNIHTKCNKTIAQKFSKLVFDPQVQEVEKGKCSDYKFAKNAKKC